MTALLARDYAQEEAARLEAREIELLRLEDRQESYGDYVSRISPEYAPVPKHLRKLYRLCEATRHRQVFARVSMPPRQGKTTTLAHLLGWWPQNNPAVLNFYVTYGESLRNATMRSVQKLAGKSGIRFARDVKNLEEWHVEGYDGGLMASTVGGQITGRGCNGGVIVADDLIKGRKAAESRLQRDTVWDYFRSDMLSRLEQGTGGASVIVVATRWHEDDIHGRLLRDPLGLNWIDIVLPAVHDGRYNAVDERSFANPVALWPEAGYDLPWLKAVRSRGEYDWWSLYQQEPRPRGRRLFNEPARFSLKTFDLTGKRLIIGCDCAGTEKTHADHSAFVVLAVSGWGDKTEVWVLHAEKMQLSTDKVAAVFLRAQRKWRAKLAVEVNGVGRGIADQVRNPRQQIDMLRRVSSAIRMVEVTRHRDKYMEAQAFSSAWNAGRVYVPDDAEWDVDDYIQQHNDFTGVDDPEDDLVDGGVNGYNHLWRPFDPGRRIRTEEAADF